MTISQDHAIADKGASLAKFCSPIIPESVSHYGKLTACPNASSWQSHPYREKFLRISHHLKEISSPLRSQHKRLQSCLQNLGWSLTGEGFQIRWTCYGLPHITLDLTLDKAIPSFSLQFLYLMLVNKIQQLVTSDKLRCVQTNIQAVKQQPPHSTPKLLPIQTSAQKPKIQQISQISRPLTREQATHHTPYPPSPAQSSLHRRSTKPWLQQTKKYQVSTKNMLLLPLPAQPLCITKPNLFTKQSQRSRHAVPGTIGQEGATLNQPSQRCDHSRRKLTGLIEHTAVSQSETEEDYDCEPWRYQTDQQGRELWLRSSPRSLQKEIEKTMWWVKIASSVSCVGVWDQ